MSDQVHRLADYNFPTRARAAARLAVFMLKISVPHQHIEVISVVARNQTDGRPVIEGTDKPSTDWAKTGLEMSTSQGILEGTVIFESSGSNRVLMIVYVRVGHDKVTINGYANSALAPVMIHGLALPEGMVKTYMQLEKLNQPKLMLG